jgi:tRNA threonylcarbamoyl adenosine modification protein YeaZ
MTYGIAIHTASSDLGLAISNFADDHRAQTWALGRALSTHMHVHLMEFMEPQTWADLAFMAVAKGPGGFTGTRIGVVTARTLAQQLGIPLFGVSTLAAVAQSFQRKLAWSVRLQSSGDIAVWMAAQRGEVYGGVYALTETGLLIPQFADAVMPQAQWEKTLADWGKPYDLVEAGAELGATAQSVLELAHLDWQQGIGGNWADILPFYGQSPV